MLSDPNLRKKLRKVKPKDTSSSNLAESAQEKLKNMSPEERRAVEEAEHARILSEQQRKMAEERENLVVEMLGFMETPNGSIEDLVDRAVKNTTIARGFLYTLVRRNWVHAYRLAQPVDPSQQQQQGGGGKKVKFVPCTVFPGIQWTSAIEIPDESQAVLEERYPHGQDYVGKGHMYRFDQGLQKHVLDEIVFYRAPAFPPPLIPFTKPEPPQDSSLANRNKWELWNKKKLAHEQSESAQYHLIYNKLLSTDTTLLSCFTQLEETIQQIRTMNEAVTASFANLPLKELRALVLSIPSQIKQVAKNLHETNGIIIRDSDLKLTPAFIKSLSNPSVAAAASASASEEANASGSGTTTEGGEEGDDKMKRRDSRNHRQDFVQFGGLPMTTILPLIQSMKMREESGMDKKARRRLTLW